MAGWDTSRVVAYRKPARRKSVGAQFNSSHFDEGKAMGKKTLSRGCSSRIWFGKLLSQTPFRSTVRQLILSRTSKVIRSPPCAWWGE